MCSFITQHNATDVARFEGACNWHADCRNVHQSCCMWIECSFLYHKPSPKAFQRIWQYIQPASQLQTADIDYLNLLYCLKKNYIPAAVIVFTHHISMYIYNIHRYFSSHTIIVVCTRPWEFWVISPIMAQSTVLVWHKQGCWPLSVPHSRWPSQRWSPWAWKCCTCCYPAAHRWMRSFNNTFSLQIVLRYYNSLISFHFKYFIISF